MLLEGLAAVLPIAVGIAVLPLPMMAVVLMLTSRPSSSRCCR